MIGAGQSRLLESLIPSLSPYRDLANGAVNDIYESILDLPVMHIADCHCLLRRQIVFKSIIIFSVTLKSCARRPCNSVCRLEARGIKHRMPNNCGVSTFVQSSSSVWNYFPCTGNHTA